ncbi:hypothetical protein [Commensalibacter oyaizuii]|uniref:Uncharacterized protein n=1 Tax=Commensalibacter oyaizuii TaxID=3043873 RepID=A0ABT6PYG0_9PROT|nr:hypothetical protein [Commensalibacter sp. TBRC 16381]MDI2089900.1 hypothetical protein [Commensalibacter sp. TBRC 16381]
MYSTTPHFIVNHIAHIYFIAEIIKKTSFSINLISPENAITYLGVRWWQSFVTRASPILSNNIATNILDCGDHGGLAMAALRLGQRHILFDSSSPQLSVIQDRAQQIHAQVITQKPYSFDLTQLVFKKKNL